MNIRNLVRTLSVAALLAVTVVTVSAQQAGAKPIRDKQTNGPRVVSGGFMNMTCGMTGAMAGQPQYDWVFYSLGEKVAMYNPSTGKTEIVMCISVNGAAVWNY